MPDLTFRRDGAHPPVKNACMYCGRPATHTRTRDITNPRLDPPGGARFDLPRGGDDLGCFAVVFLPLLLANIVMEVRDGFRHSEALKNAPPLVPPSTTVTVTTCDRHRQFWRRWGRVVLAWLAVMLVTWALIPLLRDQPGGAPLWVFAAVIVSTVAAPLILIMTWAEHGPIRVERVGRDTVTLTRVRQAYFDATP
jgi:hypothetical protein